MNIRHIAKDYDLKLIFITKNNIDKYSKKYEVEKDDLIENAQIIGDTDILLGIFADKEIRRAVLFHEIGHALVTESFEKLVTNDLQLIEFQAWIEGLKIAKKYKYEFTNKIFKYILKSIHSYYKDALHVYSKNYKPDTENI
jgi:hypothetical protein